MTAVLPRSSSLARHHFLCPSGVPLPRWLEAFPAATVGTSGGVLPRIPASGLVWLRLDPSRPARDQLAALGVVPEGAKIIALSDRPDDDEALSLFSAGIRGYCNSHASAPNLRLVADVVQAGGLWIGDALMKRLLSATGAALAATRGIEDRQGTGDAEAPALSHLSRREREVALMIADGRSNKEIARHLDITERTVKAHASAIFQKLDVRDRLQLALVVSGRQIS